MLHVGNLVAFLKRVTRDEGQVAGARERERGNMNENENENEEIKPRRGDIMVARGVNPG